MIPTLELPEKAKYLFEPKRYKILKGGRGSAKSESVARYLLIVGAQNKERILCAREFQNSIGDSVHKTLSDIINENKLESFYKVQNTSIIGRNGTEFIFEGLKHNIQSIKSKKGITKVWVEEAQTVSKASWEVLIPTIRENNSEIIASYNPNLETDETHQRFAINTPGTIITKRDGFIETDLAYIITMNWRDNPWFPETLNLERLELQKKDPDAYLNIYEGFCRQTLEGAVYANELREAMKINPETGKSRITSVPYHPNVLVNTYWDLGFSDATAIWFVQKVGMEYHVIDYYENNFQNLQHYVKYLQDKPYVYGYDYLPHDAKSRQLGTGMSIQEQLRNLGRKVQIVPKLTVNDGIMAARTVFPMCYFDKDKCADGLNALRHYRYEQKEGKEHFNKNPVHDQYSHGSDSWRYFAVMSRRMLVEKRKKKKRVVSSAFKVGHH